jgi:hypothetical protein
LLRVAFQLGTTAVGIQTSEGVVLAAEKRIGSKLLVPSSVKKLVQLDGRANTREQEQMNRSDGCARQVIDATGYGCAV